MENENKSWLASLNPLNWGNPNVELTEENKTLKNEVKSFKASSNKYQGKYRNMLESSISDLKNSKRRHILASTYQGSVNRKVDLYKQVDDIKGTYLHSAIVGLLLEDAIAVSTITNDIVNLSYEGNDEMNEALLQLQEVIDIDLLVKNVGEDLLTYGDYALSVKSKPGIGVTDINDDVEQDKFIALYKDTMPEKYLVQEGNTLTVSEKEPREFIHFAIGSRKLRIKIENQTAEEYVRVGRPLFWGTFELLRNLMLMTHLIPASYLHKINSTSIIGVQVPETMSPDDAFQACKTYETMLNKSVTFDKSSGDLTVADVLSSAGKFKCVPVYGGDRGSMNKIDTRYDEITDISVLEDLRKAILSSEGIPHSFIFGGDGNNKTETLKQFSRYVKKLHNVQSAKSLGLKQLAMIHLVDRGFSPKLEKIEVKFANTLVNIEDLDKIEFIDTLVSTLGNTVEVLTEVASKFGATIDGDKLQPFIDRYLKVVDLEGVINLKGKSSGEDDDAEESKKKIGAGGSDDKIPQ